MNRGLAVRGTPALDQPGLTAELRAVLGAAGYTGEGVRTALGTGNEPLSRPVDIPLHLRRLEGVEPLGTLVRLLVLDAPVDAEAAARAFAPLSLDDVERLGLIARDGGDVRALVRIVPHDELLIASDRRVPPGEEERPDHVAGVHRPLADALAPHGAPAHRDRAGRWHRLRRAGDPRGGVTRDTWSPPT